MNHEEEKKKELEKRGEDNPASGRTFPESDPAKEQRHEDEKMERTDADVRSSADDLAPARDTTSPIHDTAVVSDIDHAMERD